MFQMGCFHNHLVDLSRKMRMERKRQARHPWSWILKKPKESVQTLKIRTPWLEVWIGWAFRRDFRRSPGDPYNKVSRKFMSFVKKRWEKWLCEWKGLYKDNSLFPFQRFFFKPRHKYVQKGTAIWVSASDLPETFPTRSWVLRIGRLPPSRLDRTAPPFFLRELRKTSCEFVSGEVTCIFPTQKKLRKNQANYPVRFGSKAEKWPFRALRGHQQL